MEGQFPWLRTHQIIMAPDFLCKAPAGRGWAEGRVRDPPGPFSPQQQKTPAFAGVFVNQSREALVFLFVLVLILALLRFFFLSLRSALGLLGFKFAAQQFNDREVGAIALTVPEFDDPAVSTFSLGKLRRDR